MRACVLRVLIRGQYEVFALRYLLIFWGIPVGALALWYYLSINDISFGVFLLSREFNDSYFGIYSRVLGVEVDVIRDSLTRVLLIDTVFVFAVVYFKPFSRLRNWWRFRNAGSNSTVYQSEINPSLGAFTVFEAAQDTVFSRRREDSLSNAP